MEDRSSFMLLPEPWERRFNFGRAIGSTQRDNWSAGAPRALSAPLIINFCQHIDAIWQPQATSKTVRRLARLHMRFLMRFLMRHNAPDPTLHECLFREASCGLERKVSHIIWRHPSFEFLPTWRYFVAALRDYKPVWGRLGQILCAKSHQNRIENRMCKRPLGDEGSFLSEKRRNWTSPGTTCSPYPTRLRFLSTQYLVLNNVQYDDSRMESCEHSV